MKYALLFPGQGSQVPGMGKFLYDNFTLAKQTFEEASEAIKVNLAKLCFEGSEAELALTENTQPALLVTSTATQKVIRSEFGIQVAAAAGHSIGEYAALVAAEAISFSGAMKAVRIRGQAMQSAVPVGQGGMVAVLGLDPRQAQELCNFVEQSSGEKPLSPANFNSPGQIVISGSQKAIDWLKNSFKPETLWPDVKRLKLIPLQVSAPFHCEMMKPAEEKMREVLTSMEFKNSEFPIFQNFTAKAVFKADELRKNLIHQVSASVLWMQSMEQLKTEAGSLGLLNSRSQIQCIEAGAGKVLQGLLKKIDSEAFQVFNTNSLEELETIEKNQG